MVTAEDDDGVVAKPEPVQGRQQLADLVVDPCDEPVVAGLGGDDLLGGEIARRDLAEVALELRETVVRSERIGPGLVVVLRCPRLGRDDRRVGLEVAHPQQPGPVLGPVVAQPSCRLAGQGLRWEGQVRRPGRRVHADPLGDGPEPLAHGTGLHHEIDLRGALLVGKVEAAQLRRDVLFAQVHRGVARTAEPFGERLDRDRRAEIAPRVVVDPGAHRRQTRLVRGTGRHADRGIDVEALEANTVGGDRIDVGRCDAGVLVAVAADGIGAELVAEEPKDVRRGGRHLSSWRC